MTDGLMEDVNSKIGDLVSESSSFFFNVCWNLTQCDRKNVPHEFQNC